MPDSSNDGYAALGHLIKGAPDLLKSILEGSPDTISVSDVSQPDLPLTYVNPAFTKTTGYASDEALGRNCRFLQGESTNRDDVARIRKAIEDQKPIDIIVLNYKKDGEPFLNALRMAPIFDKSGRLSAYLGIQRDITQERLREEKEKTQNRLETLGTASGALAHQLNNLLHPIESLISLHLPDIPDPAIRADLDMARYSAHQAADLSNNLLGLSRGEFQNSSESTHLPDALIRTISLVQLMLPATVSIQTDFRNVPADLAIPINETLFAQVLINIITNASQATKHLGIIRIELKKTENTRLQISISDNGPGIEKSDRDKIFKPFYSKSLSKNSSGLGLPVALQIINNIGGIIILSEGLIQPDGHGYGCMFTLDLPNIT
ncbi:PAS domain-containing protein [uncultured Roseibium sp.]|uniref:two-component system sensor histidine kinase NtrB n=1 Tax=uncultured Roseibium sp. TaxID=1936171 RepID=UPI002615E908|nr:PAS domain-containing protein [uncultured Roseibium sp.]